MVLNSNEIFLLAKIEVLQKENDALKEERVATLQKLELVEAKENETFEHQIKMAKMIRMLDKARKNDKLKIAKLESDFDAGKKLYQQQIVQQNKLQEVINDASVQMTAFKRQREEEFNEFETRIAKVQLDNVIAIGELQETIKNLKQKYMKRTKMYEDLRSDVRAQNSVKMIKDPFLNEERWCKLKWGQNDKNIFLGDVTKFRLDPAEIENSKNFHQPLAYHLNWWLKLNKIEKGRQFLKKPEIIKYRNDVCLAINRRFRERIHKSVRQSPWLLKPLRQN